MLPRVIDVAPIRGHRLELAFSNGEKGVFDCTPYLEKGVFVELKDERYFQTVQLLREAGTICWPHGQDFCPDTLYVNCEKDTGVSH